MTRRLPGLDQYERHVSDDWHPDPSGARQRKSLRGGSKMDLPVLGSANPTCPTCRRYVENCPHATAVLAARQAVLDQYEDRADVDWKRVNEAEYTLPPHEPEDPRPRVQARGHRHAWWDERDRYERALDSHRADAGSLTGRTCLVCSKPEALPAEPPR